MNVSKARYHLKQNQARPYHFVDMFVPQMKESLGALIRRRMSEIGIRNNAELARLMGRSDAYVGDLINDAGKTKSGTYRPSPDTVLRLATALKLDVNTILERIGYGEVSEYDPEGLYKDLGKLPAAIRPRAIAQVKAYIEVLAAQSEHDTDYIEDTEE